MYVSLLLLFVYFLVLLSIPTISSYVYACIDIGRNIHVWAAWRTGSTVRLRVWYDRQSSLALYSNACNFYHVLSNFPTCSIWAIFHFQYFKQRLKDRSTLLLLASDSSFKAWKHPWAPQWTFLCMLFASTQKSASCKKLLVFGPLHPWSKYHSVALVLHYNMGLEQSYSIKQLQSYTMSKIRKMQCNRVVFQCFLRVYEEHGFFCWKCLVDKYYLCLTKVLE